MISVKQKVKLFGFSALCALLSLSFSAQAYQLQTVIKTEHFALNQVILEGSEKLDAPLQSSITGDVQTANRLARLYQSSTVVFPAGSAGLTGKINSPIEGVLTVANYNSGKDRIYFNRTAKYMSEAGMYISYEQFTEILNQKVLIGLLDELRRFPIVMNDLPVTGSGTDKTIDSFFITSVDNGAIIDLRLDDSVYYARNTLRQIREKCKVSVLILTDRLLSDQFPVFLSGRAAVNGFICEPLQEKQNSKEADR